MNELSWTQEREELMRAMSGNRHAVHRIVDRLSKPAFTLAYKTVLNVNDAEDCVQDAFYRLWNSKSQFQGNSSLKTYFFRFVLNACFALLAKRKDSLWEDMETYETVSSNSLENTDAVINSIDVQKALSNLTPRQRTAIVLWAYFDYSSKEIGDMMNLNNNAVDQLIHRGKQQLRKFLI